MADLDRSLPKPVPKVLLTAASIAAPFTTIATLTFVGACYFSGYVYRTLAFKEYGLSSSIITLPIQDTISQGFSNYVWIGIIGIWATCVFGMWKLLPFSRRLVQADVDEDELDVSLQSSLSILRRLILFTGILMVGSLSGKVAHDIEKAFSAQQPCFRCALYQTASKTYIGRVLGQDATMTVLVVNESAVLLKTADILAVGRYRPPPFPGATQVPAAQRTIRYKGAERP